MKGYEQYKRIVRFFSSAVLLCTQMVLYWYIWKQYYNIRMEVPYNRTGHWLMVAVYFQPAFRRAADWVYEDREYDLFPGPRNVLCECNDLFTDYLAYKALSEYGTHGSNDGG